MPVVTPSRASTETVKAVPNGVSLLLQSSGGGSSSSQRSSVRQRQISPRPCLAMKLIASGVANSAAIVRSPSFSRSSSSTTITILPWRMSSIASSMVANGALLSSISFQCSPGRRRSTYFARTSVSRFTLSPGARAPSVVAASVCCTSATANPSRRAAPPSGRRPRRRSTFLDEVAHQLGGASIQNAAVALGFDERTVPTPST